MIRESRRSSLRKGFTLIEVVVALSLLSLIMLGLVGALRAFGQTGERLEEQTLVNDDLRLVGALLQSSIASAAVLQRVEPDSKAVGVWFQGRVQGLEWLGVMPARHGVGGLMHLRLMLEQAQDDRYRLVLFMAPYRGADKEPDWDILEGRVLLEDVTDMQLRYLGFKEAGWSVEWLNETALPTKVYLALTLRGRPWPPLLIPLTNATGVPRTGASTTENAVVGFPDA